MTQLLEQAIEQVKKLPTAEQDAIASLIIEELADERRWDAAFAGSATGAPRLSESKPHVNVT